MVETVTTTEAPSKPLGLPIGSVRSIVVLLLIVPLALVMVAFAVRIISSGSDELVEKLALLVFGAVINLAGIAVAFYFKDREGGRTTTTTTEEPIEG